MLQHSSISLSFLVATFLLCAQQPALAAGVEVGVIWGGAAGGPETVAQLNDDTYFDFTATSLTPGQADTLAKLQMYECVVIGSSGHGDDNGYSDPMMAALRQYLDAGGGIVSTGWFVYGANFWGGQKFTDADYACPIDLATGGGYNYVGGGAMVQVDVLHPITMGINNFTHTSANYEYDTAIDVGAVKLCSLPSAPGSQAVVYQDVTGRSVYVGGMYLSSPSSYSTAGLRSGVEDQLFEQAVFWAAGGSPIDILSIDAVPTMVAPGQTGIAVTMEVENTSQNSVDVTAVDLTFQDASMMDVSSEYTVVASPGNPTVVPAGATLTMNFTVDVSAMASLGTITIDGTFAGIEQPAARAFTSSGAMMTDTWDVVSALASVRVVDATDAIVAQGGSSYPVSVSVENLGLNQTDVVGVSLSFTGTSDRTSEYVVNPAPGNPTAIAPGTTETFDFLVDVSLMATVETITLDAGFGGSDSVTMVPVLDMDADVTDQWDVLMCAATVCGDCTGDGLVTILDALISAQHSAALVTLTGTDFTNCNVIGAVEPDPTAAITILDALTIAQSSAGLPVVLVCC